MKAFTDRARFAKKLLLGLVSGAALGHACGNDASTVAAAYPRIARGEIKQRLEAGTLIVFDANGTESYREGHVPGALDFEALSPRFPLGLPDDKSAPLAVYCGGPRCMAWKTAADSLAALGYTSIFHFPGGLQEWSEAGLALDTGSVGSPDPIRPPLPFARCNLSAGAQATRLGALRTGLFRKILRTQTENGTLALFFPAAPAVVRELRDFIRFEEKCCPSLRYGLRSDAGSGNWVLELHGPPDAVAAFEEVALAR